VVDGIERGFVLEHAKGEMDEFTHSGSDNEHFGFAFGVNIPPPINPDFRPLLALMTAEKAVLIPWSIQETFLSFRPRWLV
jgi:hypothetical protein